MTTPDPTPEQRRQLRQRGAAAVMWLIGGMMEDERMNRKTYDNHEIIFEIESNAGKVHVRSLPPLTIEDLQKEKDEQIEELKATIARLESTVKGLQKFADEDAARIEALKAENILLNEFNRRVLALSEEDTATIFELEALVRDLTAALESAGELEARF